MTKSHFTFDFFCGTASVFSGETGLSFFGEGELEWKWIRMWRPDGESLGRRVGWKSDTRLTCYIQVSLAPSHIERLKLFGPHFPQSQPTISWRASN